MMSLLTPFIKYAPVPEFVIDIVVTGVGVVGAGVGAGVG
jgi:hypothetical protein